MLWNCETDHKNVMFKAQSYKNTSPANINVIIHEAQGNDARAERINHHVEALIANTIYPDTSAMSIQKTINTFNSDYEDFLADFPDTNNTWELYVESEISYQSESVLSMAINIYRYEGGAHGNDKIVFLNLNPKTGEVYDFNDLVSNKDVFKAKAKTFFIKHLELKEQPTDISDYFYGSDFKLPEEIGFCEEGVILLYNVYEIASYAQGYTEFVIPFEDLENTLNVY